MELDNLNDIISHLKKMNEEVIQCKIKSDVDLKAYNELKAQYIANTKELEESTKKVDHLRRLCKVLEEKLSKFLTVRSEYQKLGNRMKRMQRKLELTVRENKAYERELEEVKSMFNTTSITDQSLVKIMDLQESLNNKEKEYQDHLEKVRSDARKSLITLESKILERVKREYAKENLSLSDEVKKKLMDNEYIIEALNLANLKLKEKLELKEYQYQELENNYLVLKVNSQHKQKSSENLSFNSKKDDRTDSYNKKLMARNIEDVIKELKTGPDSKEVKVLMSNTSQESQRSQNDSNNVIFAESHDKTKLSDAKYHFTTKKRSAEMYSTITNESSLETFVFPQDSDTDKNIRKYQNDYYEFIEEIFVGHRCRDDDQNGSTEVSDNETFDNTEELVSLKDIDCMGEFKIDIKENEISVEVKRCCHSESSSTEKIMDFNHKN